MQGLVSFPNALLNSGEREYYFPITRVEPHIFPSLLKQPGLQSIWDTLLLETSQCWAMQGCMEQSRLRRNGIGSWGGQPTLNSSLKVNNLLPRCFKKGVLSETLGNTENICTGASCSERWGLFHCWYPLTTHTSVPVHPYPKL